MTRQGSPRSLWRDVLNLAAPQTWAGSMAPATVALAIAWHRRGALDATMAACLYAAVLLMQSAVNAFDDYADFVKGTDTLANSPDAQDAVIVYGMKPRAALLSGVAFLAAGLLVGLYVVLKLGVVPLVIGGIGAAVLLLYAFGPCPICYLPLGEAFCGFVLGGLVPLAGVYMQTRTLDYFVLVEAIPPILGMAVNMFSNNGSDIARDLPAGRRTLACLLGQRRTDALYRAGLVVWVASPAAVLAAQCRWSGALVYGFVSLAFAHLVVRQYRRRLGPDERGEIMTGATTLVTLVGLAYSVAMLVG